MNWLKRFFMRERLYAELDEEIAAHLEERVEELVREGMSQEEAEAKARKEFGNVTAVKQTAREAWGWQWIEDFFVDLRYGLRMSRKSPVLTLAAVLTLALGIGANTAIFTLLYGLVLRSLPVAEAGQLAKVGVASTAEPDSA
jgi:putative ABC transport system permease protein